VPGASAPTKGLEEALARVLLLGGRFRDAHRGEKVQITEDGIWTIKSFIKEEGVHRKTTSFWIAGPNMGMDH
jgi:hypothetical protein